MQQESTSWYKQEWFIVLTLIFIFPLGLFVMWRYSKWPSITKSIITVAIVVIALSSITYVGNLKTNNYETQPTVKTDNETADTANNTENINYDDSSTDLHMSKQGIYDQLTSEYGEKFNKEDAQFAIDHLDANYEKNALEKAKSYAKDMHMSDDAIYDILVSEYGEKFTDSEAKYAVDHLDN